ncbi:endonuclease III [Myxosarcina sp. GI1]|uniref:endonuclease III domain-containing protein n=1 Tax=Myxosarcina sp. GI1 TaxID=1541065 RepID=UPI00055F8C0A|nr:endonuclease III [Myxosarcina sp. GI1]
MTLKRSLDIETAITKLRETVKPFPKAAMFALADEGYTSAFEQLIACIISIRTYDEVSLPVSRRLFAVANTPTEVSQLSLEQIESLIEASTYAKRKAAQIKTIAETIVSEYDGVLPCDAEVMLSFKGVGVKCSNLTLGIACGQPHISVDVHVHRVTNRWGYVRTKTPEQTTADLATKLPQKYWIKINNLLVPFGKHICTGKLPRCSSCSLLEMCQQVDVVKHR